SGCVVCGGGRQVGGQRLGGRPQVELDTTRNHDRSRRRAETDRLPARDALRDQSQGTAARLDRREVAVVTGQADYGADRRVDSAIRELRPPQRGGDRLGEQRADDGDLVWSRIQHAELAVLTKPTCREVHRSDDLVHRFLGRDQRLGPGYVDPKRAAERAIVRDAEDGGAHFLT